jgi:hypothetical protein
MMTSMIALPSMTIAALVLSLCSASGEDGIVQQKVVVGGTAGVIAQDIKNAATRMQAAIDKRNDLAAERRDNIERLTAELQRCGDCPNRQALSDELALWKTREAVIHVAEGLAIKSMGLEKYGDMRGIKAAWADYLEHYNLQTPAEKAKADLTRAANAAQQYCAMFGNAAGEANARDRPIRRKCLSEYEANDMVFQGEIARHYCFSQNVDSSTKNTRWLYRSECLDWNDPTKRLVLLMLRMQGVPFENQAEKRTVDFWCRYVGSKSEDLPGTTDPVTGDSDKVRSQARSAAFRDCKAQFNLAEMVRQRDQAELECTRGTSNDFDRRSSEVIACLLKRDRLRRMAVEWMDAFDIDTTQKNARLQKQLDERFAPKKQ